MKQTILCGFVVAALLLAGCGKGANLKELGRNAERCDRLNRVHDRTTACSGTEFTCDGASEAYVNCADAWSTEYCQSVGFGGGENAFTNCLSGSADLQQDNSDFSNGSANEGVGDNDGFSNNVDVEPANECDERCNGLLEGLARLCPELAQSLSCEGECNEQRLHDLTCASQNQAGACDAVAGTQSPAREALDACMRSFQGSDSSECYADCEENRMQLAENCPDVSEDVTCAPDQRCDLAQHRLIQCQKSFPQGACDLLRGRTTPDSEAVLSCVDSGQ